MSNASATASAFALALTCAGCGNWSGFGFDAGGPEMPRLRQVLALKEGMVLAEVGAGKGQLTLALAREVGSSGRVFSTEIDPARLARLREAAGRAGLDNVTVVEAQSCETGLPLAMPTLMRQIAAWRSAQTASRTIMMRPWGKPVGGSNVRHMEEGP